MEVKFGVIILLEILHVIVQANEYLNAGKTNQLKIAFGSCNKFHASENSDIFYSIASYEPDVYIWIGRNFSSKAFFKINKQIRGCSLH